MARDIEDLERWQRDHLELTQHACSPHFAQICLAGLCSSGKNATAPN
jgi:hypothetical protein